MRAEAVASASAGEPPFSEVVSLTLADAVPYECRDEPLPGMGAHNPYRELQVDVTCREGRWHATAWAYSMAGNLRGAIKQNAEGP